MINKIKNNFLEEGLFKTMIKIPPSIYRNYIRRGIPTVGFQTFSNVNVKPIKLGDQFLPVNWRSFGDFKKPNYESALIKGLGKYVEEGDKVLIIGGGIGVTTCIASQLAGNKGKIISFEASIQSYENTRNTLSYNSLPDNVVIHNKCVGKPVSIWGDLSKQNIVEPVNLPDCDIMELDCEGAEKEILNNLKINPRTILVEAHGIFNSTIEEIIEIIKGLFYEIESVEVADVDQQLYCQDNEIKVIIAHRQMK